MQHRVKILTKIKEGMEESCVDMEHFTGCKSNRICAEYLLTVNIAKKIRDLNSFYGEPYKIHLEKSTRNFARDCIPLFARGNPLTGKSKNLRKGIPEILRNGRIDIAVYCENLHQGEIPLCAIELKGFNPQDSVITKDLERNIEFLLAKGNTGSSMLDFTVFAALHSKKKCFTEGDRKKNKSKIEQQYKDILESINSKSICSEITLFDVSLDDSGTIIDDGYELTIDTSTRHHFIGSIVCFFQASSRN